MESELRPSEEMQSLMSMVQNAANQFAADDDIRYAPQDDMAFEIEQAAFDVYKVWLWDSNKIQQQKLKTGQMTSRNFLCIKQCIRGQDKCDHLTKSPQAEKQEGNLPSRPSRLG